MPILDLRAPKKGGTPRNRSWHGNLLRHTKGPIKNLYLSVSVSPTFPVLTDLAALTRDTKVSRDSLDFCLHYL